MRFDTTELRPKIIKFITRVRLPSLVILAVTLTYLNHFNNAFQFDDSHAILDNPAIRSLNNIPRMLWDAGMSTPLAFNKSYRPLMTISLTLDYALGGGLKPFFFHLSTFVFFVFQLVAMGLLFESLLGSRRQAWLAVALYGLHPAAAQTVNYVCQRPEIYVALALCLGMWLHRQGHQWWALIPFALGCLAKQNGVVFPALVFMYEWLLGGRHFRRTLPSILMAGCMVGIIYAFSPKTFVAGGAPLPVHLTTQCYVVLTYLKTAVWPTDLVGDSDLLAFEASDPRAAVGFGGLAILLLMLLRCSALTRFGWCWYFIAQAPTLLVPLSDATNDHRLYGPFVGLALIVGNWAKTTRRQVFLLLLLPLLSYGTYQRNIIWHTPEGFWKEVTEKSPTSGRGMMNYGLSFYMKGENKTALRYMLMAKPYLSTTFSPFYLNLGAIYGEMNKPKEAEEAFKTAMQYDNGSTPLYIFGCFLEKQHRIGEAMLALREAYALNPRDSRPLQRYKQMRERVAQTAAITKSAEGYMDLSMLLYAENAYEDALKAAQYASDLEPKNAASFSNQAACLLALGRAHEAEHMAEKALQLDPALHSAQENLRVALRRQAERKN